MLSFPRRPLTFLGIMLFAVGSAGPAVSQQRYADLAEALIDSSLLHGQAYDMLRDLTQKVGARLSGSPQAAAAVAWAQQTMLAAGLENIHLQPVVVPHWVRGNVEAAKIVGSRLVGDYALTICALGGSVATPAEGVTAEIVEVQNFEQVQALGGEAAGKIIFYNRPLDRRERQTFAAYGGAVNQRGQGAIEAARVGAVATLVRSMTTRIDDVPHTGAMRYEEGVKKIPAAAISTLDAEFLSRLLKKEGTVRVHLELSCQTLPDVESANVIGELPGTDLPGEVILLGGHLDSWDKGQGAHDDGSGCVQSIEALRLIKAMGLRPKRTIRAVLFMNEENGLRGGLKYAEEVAQNGPRHLAAIESDGGGFTPRGFSVADSDDRVQRLKKWEPLFGSIMANYIVRGGGGADIGPLRRQGTVAIGLRVDAHRYFDYHHSDNDTFDKVNERELELGAAAMAIFAYVLANEGTE